MTKLVIELDIDKCDKCPFVKIERPAFAYICGVNARMIKGRVVDLIDVPEVPEWCPYMWRPLRADT